MKRQAKTKGFTLVELLVVVAIVALLAALLFPVFASARGAARKSVCVSNLRQLGMAVSMYATDYDDFYPYGADPSDQYTVPPIWGGTPYAAEVLTMPLLNPNNYNGKPAVLAGYVQDKNLFHCPADKGFVQVDVTGSDISPAASPTAFDEYGTSYFYRTEIALRHEPYSSLTVYEGTDCTEHGPAELNVLMDANGSWHGGVFSGRRYNVLMGDGHAVSQTAAQFDKTWQRSLVPTPGCH